MTTFFVVFFIFAILYALGCISIAKTSPTIFMLNDEANHYWKQSLRSMPNWGWPEKIRRKMKHG